MQPIFIDILSNSSYTSTPKKQYLINFKNNPHTWRKNAGTVYE